MLTEFAKPETHAIHAHYDSASSGLPPFADAPIAIWPESSIPAQRAIAGFFRLRADFPQAVNEGFQLDAGDTLSDGVIAEGERPRVS